ncbi:uncharacterized protein TNCV_1937961 [Trichonephila clavipes]|nr:uncharacterized protein TNCV_1937961 [Trichonephila clavipes]
MDAETAKVLRGRAKAALTRTKNFIGDDETFDKNDIRNNNGTNIDNQLKQFWELEVIPNVKDKILTSEEQFVETHFQNTYACNSDGRFVVKLPFYKSNSELEDSKPAAISRLLAMERKFKNNPDFEKQYKEFRNEYKSLGHMSLVNSHTSDKYLNFFYRITPLSSRPALQQKHSSHDTQAEFSKDSNESSKVLGLFWNSSNDTFGFQPSFELTPPLTKRRILSESSKIFDPLGLLAACTVFMKIFYQKLWFTKTDWNSPIPQQLTKDWLRLQKAFNEINYLTVPRWVILTADNTVELHGFADAASLAYAAAVYCRRKRNGKIKVQLLVSNLQ